MEFKEILDKIFNNEKALSYSALSQFLKSPRHYYRYLMETETTPAMEEGKRFHMAILEPEKYAETYYIFDDSLKVQELIDEGSKSPRATNVYKEWKIEELKKYEGKEQINQEEHDIYQKMIKTLHNHSVCKDLLIGEGENEKYFEFEEEFKFRGYIDRATPNFTVDIKKVADAQYKKVKWNIVDMNYDLQSVIYSKANRTSLHYLIFIDKGCNVTVVQVSPETIEIYEEKFNFAIESFSRCLETDSWNMSYDFWQPYVRI